MDLKLFEHMNIQHLSSRQTNKKIVFSSSIDFNTLLTNHHDFLLSIKSYNNLLVGKKYFWQRHDVLVVILKTMSCLGSWFSKYQMWST